MFGFEFNIANVCSNPEIVYFADFRYLELARISTGEWIFGGLFMSDCGLYIEGLPCTALNGKFTSRTAVLSEAYHFVKNLEIKNGAPYSKMLLPLGENVCVERESGQLSLF